MGKAHLVFTGFLSVLLSLMLVPSVNGLSLVSLSNRAGLPYPQEGYEGTIFLKEVFVTLNITSAWRRLEGYDPWHQVTINHKATYVFENIGASTSLQVKIPIMSFRNLTFRLEGQTVNPTSVERLRGKEPGSGLIMSIYTLTITDFPRQNQRTLEVEAEQFGATSPEAQYFYFMENASRWIKPIEEFGFDIELKGGRFTDHTINPTTLNGGRATWNMTNLTPSRDLIIKWEITEPKHPFPFIIIIGSVVAAAFMIGLLTSLRQYALFALGIILCLIAVIFMVEGIITSAKGIQIERTTGIALLFVIVGIGLIATSGVRLLKPKKSIKET